MRTAKYILFALCTLLASSAWGQKGSFIEFSAGGGWSTYSYSLANAPGTLQTSQSGSYGLTFHAGYGYMFNDLVGLGIGLDASRYGSSAKLSGVMQWKGVTDTDGEKYNHIARIDAWQDKQSVFYLEIPLTLYFAVPTQSIVRFSAELGVKFGLPISQKATFAADVTHSGEYPQWLLTLTDVPDHGFTTTHLEGSSKLNAKSQLSAFAKLGVIVPITDQLDFFTHVYFNCGMLKNSIGEHENTQPFGLREDTEQAKETYYFMAPAVSVLQTAYPKGTFLPLSAGLEIGIRLHFRSAGHNYPCKCVRN